jgi:hypothetical protein
MGQQVVNGAMMTCSFGAAPSTLAVPPENRTMVGGVPAANVMDFKPNANIPPFGMCTSLTNPQVAAATSAAAGVLTPQPCIPVTTSPWTPGSSTVKIGNMPALNDSSTCMCAWAGTISITYAGQASTMVS